MEGKSTNDFVLDSKGHCFLFLDKISRAKHELGSVPPPIPKYSLYYLSRYLKMDMRKVFHDRDQIPSHLLVKVQSSRLKVGLCKECVSLNEQFSENYRELEKAEIKLGSCLTLIHEKFLNGSGTRKTEDLKKLTNVEPHFKFSSDGGGELEIMSVLRKEAFMKSQAHHKLRPDMPRVNFQNLTRNQIQKEKLKFKVVFKKQRKTFTPQASMDDSDSSNTESEATNIKMELETATAESASDASILSDEDNGNYPSNDSNLSNEAMGVDGENSNLLGTEEPSGSNIIHMPMPRNVPSLTTKHQCKSRTQAGIPVSCIIPETEKHRCGTCSKEFSSKMAVQRHYEGIHLKVRFKCATCGKQITTRDDCNRHQKSAHVGVTYACQVCGKSFTQTWNIKKHLRTTDCGKKLGLKSGSGNT